MSIAGNVVSSVNVEPRRASQSESSSTRSNLALVAMMPISFTLILLLIIMLQR